MSIWAFAVSYCLTGNPRKKKGSGISLSAAAMKAACERTEVNILSGTKVKIKKEADEYKGRFFTCAPSTPPAAGGHSSFIVDSTPPPPKRIRSINDEDDDDVELVKEKKITSTQSKVSSPKSPVKAGGSSDRMKWLLQNSDISGLFT